jgi:adenylate cyclase
MATILIVAMLHAAFTGGGDGNDGVRIVIYALIIATPLAAAEIYAFGCAAVASHRRWPFAAILSARALGYAAWIAVGATIAARLTHTHDEAAWQDLLLHKETLAVAAGAALLANGFMVVSRLLGTNTLRRVVSGRYHQPRIEERLFAFVDVRGSTGMAEQLGDLRFHRLLTDIFHLIEVTAIEAGGEIHDYIGDQVMLTWPAPTRRIRPAPGALSPLYWIAALALRLEEARPRLRALTGVVPELRIGMHIGQVAVGEVGTFRTKVTYLGDTVNTAARIEQFAREHQALALVSAPVLERFPLAEGLSATLLGTPLLRGKQYPIPVYGIHAAAGDMR